MSGEPSLHKAIKDTIESRLTDLNVCLPGKVVKVDVSAGKCDVQPLIKRKFGDGTIVDLPVITNVPIANYRAGKAAVYLPLHVGDMVQLTFAQRSLDIWLSKGGTVDPKDPRKHHISDAIAYPGVYPFSDPPSGADANNIVIKNDQAVLTVLPSGKFKIANSSDELLDCLVNICTQLETMNQNLFDAMTATLLGSQPLSTKAAFQTIKTEITTLKSKITGLKG